MSSPETPYSVSDETRAAAIRVEAERAGIDPRAVRPDGSLEPDQTVSPEAWAKFFESVNEINARLDGRTPSREIDGESGEIRMRELSAPAATEAGTKIPNDLEAQKAIFAKVAAFLDPKTRGPVTLFEVRHKVFIMRIPVAQELIDVTQFTGQLAGTPPTEAQAVLSIIGELLKACYGWLPANSVDVQNLRANIQDPQKWPTPRPIMWLSTRDPFYIEKEVYPLWDLYAKWRNSVTPTAEEIDFYYSQMD